ncbi:concanavalin A-like lectin/glucanase domain-containing protein [Mariannaea sp. PMI_226]|nr:concanavalin A-like lectin/glucanase domain-containing protein [Mariannaea sp. PMI_226]
MHQYCTLALTAAAALFSRGVAAQDCDPVQTTGCAPDVGLATSKYSVDFTAGADNSNWQSIGGGDVVYSKSGAEFTINKKGDSPTIQTSWYLMFGRIEVHMKAAPGQGVISSVVMLSDDKDEIDWEFLGGFPDEVQTNYFGKGDSSTPGRGGTSPVVGSQATSHNYTLDWTEKALSWYIDGTLMRTLTYSQAANGAQYPQTPSRVKLGIWAGGDPDNAAGTIAWAGGLTDFTKGPYTMTVESVSVTNYNPAKSYTYSDKSGAFSSIKFDKVSGTGTGTTTTKKATTAVAAPTTTKKAAPTTTKKAAATTTKKATSAAAHTTTKKATSAAAAPTTTKKAASAPPHTTLKTSTKPHTTAHASTTTAIVVVKPPTSTHPAGSAPNGGSSGNGLSHHGYGWHWRNRDQHNWSWQGHHIEWHHGKHHHHHQHAGHGKFRHTQHPHGGEKGKGYKGYGRW